VISRALDICGLFGMVFDCLWVVVDVFEVVAEFFEVVVGGFGWLWVVPSFSNYVYHSKALHS